jgi:putative heme-binding domain-containing protein
LKANSIGKISRVNEREFQITAQSKQNGWLPLDLALETGGGEPNLELTWHTVEDPRPRALPLRRMLLPWATPKSGESFLATERTIPEIAGGNWNQGKQLFFSEQVACYKCHQMRGEGGKIAPDLSNLIHRDYASVMKDILQPSAAINPDHLAYNIELKDGDVLNGVLLSDDGATMVLGLVDGKTTTVPKTKVAAVKSSAISLMPENLLQGLSQQQQKDLFTFLLTAPPASTVEKSKR